MAIFELSQRSSFILSGNNGNTFPSAKQNKIIFVQSKRFPLFVSIFTNINKMFTKSTIV